MKIGTNVNANFFSLCVIPTPEQGPAPDESTWDVGYKFSGCGTSAEVSFLHQAVRNCYDVGESVSSAAIRENALDILKLIIEFGGDKSHSCTFCICNIDSYKYYKFTGTAMDLALYFKKRVILSKNYAAESNKILDVATRILMPCIKSADQPNPQTTQVLVTTFERWCKLFYDTDLADVKLLCADGKTLQAHKHVLGVSSPYFKTLFLGPWKENECNIIQIPESSSVLSAFLKFMYTGLLDSKVLEENVRSLLGLSAQYMLPCLQKLCEQRCVTTLSLENIKDVLLLANLHNSKDLKNSCFNFIRDNSTAILRSPNILILNTEDPILWAELVANIGGANNYIGGGSSSNREKRKRQETLVQN